MKKYTSGVLAIYSSVFEFIDSNMYVVIENSEALIIDPHKNDEIYELLLENGVKNILMVLTHEHPDHISGVHWFKNHFKTQIIATKESADYLSNSKNLRPIMLNFILEEMDRVNGTQLLDKFKKECEFFPIDVDVCFDESLEYQWQSHILKFKSTQGHSKGSCCVILDDKLIFTGDSLMKNYPIIVRFPRSSKKDYQNLSMPFFEGLDKGLKVFPGHGEPFELKDLFKDGKLNVEFR